MNTREYAVLDIVDDFHAVTKSYIKALEIIVWTIRIFLVFALLGVFEFASNMNQ